MKMLIEVRGGNIQNIIASEECSIVIVDWDSINSGEPFKADVFQPDCIAAYGEPLYKYFGKDDRKEYNKLKKINF
jgi:hypothetical protein